MSSMHCWRARASERGLATGLIELAQQASLLSSSLSERSPFSAPPFPPPPSNTSFVLKEFLLSRHRKEFFISYAIIVCSWFNLGVWEKEREKGRVYEKKSLLYLHVCCVYFFYLYSLCFICRTTQRHADDVFNNNNTFTFSLLINILPRASFWSEINKIAPEVRRGEHGIGWHHAPASCLWEL